MSNGTSPPIIPNVDPGNPGMSNQEIDNSSYKAIVVRWAYAQGVPTVLLLMILLGLGWFGDYALRVALPANTDHILRTVQATTENQNKAISELASSHKDTISKITDEYKSTRLEFMDLIREINGVPGSRRPERATGYTPPAPAPRLPVPE